MAYQTGSAISYADLLSSLTAFLTANGWTWDSANSVLSKGAQYYKLTSSTTALSLQAGLGVSSGALVTPCGYQAQISNLGNGTVVGATVTFPATYYFHVTNSPKDAVAVLVNYSSTVWQYLIFGEAVNLGTSSSAIYCSGTWSNASRVRSLSNPTDNSNYGSMGPFNFDGSTVDAFSAPASFLYSDLDSAGWLGGYLGSVLPRAWPEAINQLSAQPNQWNQEVVLIPVRIIQLRASNLYSLIAEIDQIRYVRNTYLNDGDIITIGTDKWKTYPFFKKDSSNPGGSSASYSYGSSGTYAIAVRYDGP